MGSIAERQAAANARKKEQHEAEVAVEIEYKKAKVNEWMKEIPFPKEKDMLTVQCCGYDGLWEGAGQDHTEVHWKSNLGSSAPIRWPKRTSFVCLKINAKNGQIENKWFNIYKTELEDDKMVEWLKTFKDHHILVLTVNDTAIRKNPRPKVGAAKGVTVPQIKNNILSALGEFGFTEQKVEYRQPVIFVGLRGGVGSVDAQ